jgi:hypothetical protein
MGVGVSVMRMSRTVMPDRNDRNVFGGGRIGPEAELTKDHPSAETRYTHDHAGTISESAYGWQ